MLKDTVNILKKAVSPDIWRAGLLLFILSVIFMTSNAWAGADDYDCPTMDVLNERYKTGCMPCMIVKVLIASFMRAAGNVYDVSREAGVKLLMFGSMIWLVFWALKKVASFTNPEPMAMMNELLIFFGKVILAFVFINSGIGTLVGYAINPILAAGADYGSALLNTGSEENAIDLSTMPAPENAYSGPTDIVSEDVMNKILRFSEGVSNEVATNLVIGNALTCFSIQQGYHWNFVIKIHIPDIWLWLCGAAIWVVGFLLTLSVCYYLIDIPFKLGFAIIALPVVIGLWPFKMTAGKLKSCVMIAVNAAGTFLFLALSVSYAMVLISAGLRDKDKLLQAFTDDDVTYVQETFAITGPYFLIILFCYIYGFQMIGNITNKMPSKFFGGSMTASAGSPLHQMATGATNWVKGKVTAPLKMARDIVANQAGKAATTVAKAAGNVGLGAASYGAGIVTNKFGKGMSAIGGKLAGAGRGAQQQLDADGKLMDMNRTNGAAKAGNRFQSALAGMVGKTGELMQNAGNKTSAGGDMLKAPLRNTAAHIKDAYNASTAELKDAVKDVAGLMPESAGNAIAAVGGSFMKATEGNQFMRDKNGNAILGKDGQPLTNISARVMNKIGSKIQNLGAHVATSDSADSLSKAADMRLKRQMVTTLRQAGKVASYVPGGLGEKIKKGGLTLQLHALTRGSESGGAAMALGKGMESLGDSKFSKFIDNNKAPEGSHRDKIKKFTSQVLATEGNIKQRTLKTAWNTIKLGGKAAAGGIVKGGAYVFNAKNDWEQLKTQAATLKDTTKNFKANFKEQLGSNMGNAADSTIGLGKTIKNMPKDWGKGIVGSLKAATRHDGLNGEFKATAKDMARRTNNMAKNISSDNIHGVTDAVLMPAAAVLGGAIMAKDLAETYVEGMYSATMHTAFAGIDAAKIALNIVPVQPLANIAGHTVSTLGDYGKVVAGMAGQPVNVLVDTAKTVGYASKMVVNVPLRAVGAVVGFTAKTVDNTLYAAYSATVKPTLAVAGLAKEGVTLGYRAVAATRAGKTVNRVAHGVRGTFKVGLKTLQIGTNIIKGAAGEGPRRPAKILTPEEKARQEELKKQRLKEERRKEDKLRKQREEKAREERLREREEERRREQEERIRLREEEAQKREEDRERRRLEEEERRKQEEEERRRRNGGAPTS